jgi:hypothetical protein
MEIQMSLIQKNLKSSKIVNENGNMNGNRVAKLLAALDNGERGKKKRPDGISNADWYKYIANKRIPMAFKALDGIMRMSNPDSYEYSEKQVNKLIEALEERMEAIKDAFNNPRKNVKKVTQKFYQ